MRIIALFFLFLSFANFVSIAQTEIFSIRGAYQGKNIYVQNPFTNGISAFCVTEVLVNGKSTKDEIQSSSFEVDFKAIGFKIGDSLDIILKHKPGCKPKVLNPEVLFPRASFDIIDIKLNTDGLLEWSTKNEFGKLNFIVEQYRWNRWVKIGQIEGKGTQSVNNYSYKVPLHSGNNQIRVKQIDYTKIPKMSRVVEIKNNTCKVVLFMIKATSEIKFICENDKSPIETKYEIFNQYGHIVKQGNGNYVSVADLSQGIYYLNYDNFTEEFSKK